jgi:hypothetical protein
MFFSRLVTVGCLAFHSKEFYKDLYFNVKGIKFGYLLFILAISNLMLIVFCSSLISSMFDVSSPSSRGILIIEQMPMMQMKGGGLYADNQSKPVEIKDGKRKIAIIDIDAFPEKYINSRIPLFINKTSVYISDGGGGYYKILDFDTYFSDDNLLDKSFLIQIFSAFKTALMISAFLIFYPLGLLLRCIFLSLNLAVFSFFGLLYGKFVGLKLNFKDLFRVSIFTSFPALLIDCVIIFYLFLSNRFFFDFYYKMHSPSKENFIFLLSVGYFVFAVKSIYDSGILVSRKKN